MQLYLDEGVRAVEELGGRLRLLHPIHQITEHLRRAARLHEQLLLSIRHRLDQEQRRLEGFAGRLQALSPLAVLARGYSITFALPQRRPVTDAQALRLGQELETLVARGAILSKVTAVRSPERGDRVEGTAHPEREPHGTST